MYIEILEEELEKYGLKVPLLTYPEFMELGNVNALVEKLKELAKQY